MNTKLVDGFRVRNTIDVDFSGVGSKSMYAYIPENELWIDEVLAGEKEFYEKVHTLEKQLLAQGLSYAETRARICKEFLVSSEQKPNPTIYAYPHMQLTINVVDGCVVRKHYDPKFIQGGHDLVYPYIPSGRIWVETAFQEDHDYIVLHEVFERNLMLTGMSYDDAHEFACAAEKNERRRKGVSKYLKG